MRNLKASSCAVTGDLPRQEIVAELVAAGYGVESVDGHRQLEEVFMSLVGTGRRWARKDAAL